MHGVRSSRCAGVPLSTSSSEAGPPRPAAGWMTKLGSSSRPPDQRTIAGRDRSGMRRRGSNHCVGWHRARRAARLPDPRRIGPIARGRVFRGQDPVGSVISDREPSGCETTTTADCPRMVATNSRGAPGAVGARRTREARPQESAASPLSSAISSARDRSANDVSDPSIDVFGIPRLPHDRFKSVRAYRRCCWPLHSRRTSAAGDRAPRSPYRTFPKVCMSSPCPA